MSYADNIDALRWWDAHINDLIDARIRSLGIPSMFMSGIVSTTRTTNGHLYADVKLNGSSTASTNIPVNPDIASNVTTGTPVWVVSINFNNLDLFVLARKLA